MLPAVNEWCLGYSACMLMCFFNEPTCHCDRFLDACVIGLIAVLWQLPAHITVCTGLTNQHLIDAHTSISY